MVRLASFTAALFLFSQQCCVFRECITQKNVQLLFFSFFFRVLFSWNFFNAQQKSGKKSVMWWANENWYSLISHGKELFAWRIKTRPNNRTFSCVCRKYLFAFLYATFFLFLLGFRFITTCDLLTFRVVVCANFTDELIMVCNLMCLGWLLLIL